MREIDKMDFCEELIEKAKPQWTPVTERLPIEDKLVLMYCKNGSMFVGYYGKSWSDSEGRWHVKTALNSTKLLNKGRVTHWMQLPREPRG